MIGYLEGTVRTLTHNRAVILVSGVGYRVACTKNYISRLSIGEATSLHIYTSVREDALDLFGFSEESELIFFELLLSVSGIGPKSALAILDMAPVETLRAAISGGNAAYLTTVSGIGKKTAEKIVLELRDKVGVVAAQSFSDDGDTLEALKTLGYSPAETREVLKLIPQNITSSSARVREALRLLGKK